MDTCYICLSSAKLSSAKIKISSFFDRYLWKITRNAGNYGRLSGYKEIFYIVLVLKKKQKKTHKKTIPFVYINIILLLCCLH